MKIMTFNIRNLVAIAIVAVTAVVVLIGVYAVSKYDLAINKQRQVIELYVERHDLSQQTLIDFKWQQQEWKNILLRGQEPENYYKYLSQFYSYERLVRKNSFKLKSAIEDDSNLKDKVEEFLVAHKKLGKHYRDAIKIYNKSIALPHIVADKYVIGKDRAVADLLTSIIKIIYKNKTEKLINVDSELRRTKYIVVSITISIAIFIFIFIIIFVDRVISKPITKVTETAKNISMGRFDNKINRNNFVSEIQYLFNALNKMQLDLSGMTQSLIAAKEEVLAAQDELVRKGRLATLGQLTATVSHELRNPLGAMRPSIYIIQKTSDKNDERLQKAIERVDRNIDRCDNIIDELLDFTRISELNVESVVVDDWLNSVIDDQDIPEGILLEKDFDLKNIHLDIDTDRLRRAVINVFDNGCHAMMDDNQKLVKNITTNMTIKTRKENERVEIIISDTGSGIEKDILDKIFEPLFSTKGFGVGLGMPTVKQIMEQHGGGIEINSEKNKGTQVTLWLPLDRPDIDGQYDND